MRAIWEPIIISLAAALLCVFAAYRIVIAQHTKVRRQPRPKPVIRLSHFQDGDGFRTLESCTIDGKTYHHVCGYISHQPQTPPGHISVQIHEAPGLKLERKYPQGSTPLATTLPADTPVRRWSPEENPTLHKYWATNPDL